MLSGLKIRTRPIPIPKEASDQDKPFTNTDAIDATIMINPRAVVFHAFMFFIFIDLGLCSLQREGQ